MNNPHTPVMLNEVIECLAPADNETYIDGTFGAGGYTKAILEKANCFVYGMDRDLTVLPIAEEVDEQYPDRFCFIAGRFGEMIELFKNNPPALPPQREGFPLQETEDRRQKTESLEFRNSPLQSPLEEGDFNCRGVACHAHRTKEYPTINGIVLDLGVSSMQLDKSERGFSFSKEAPLDMRMGQDGITAAELINSLEEEELADIIYQYGGERLSRKIARAIAQNEKPITTTTELTEIIHKTIGSRSGKIDSATRTFQALRIYINDELGELQKALEAAEELLAPNGRLVIVSFHSLEDKIAKEFLRDRTGQGSTLSRHIPQVCIEKKVTFNYIHKKALKPSNAEVLANPRSRSARLRAARRVTV